MIGMPGMINWMAWAPARTAAAGKPLIRIRRKPVIRMPGMVNRLTGMPALPAGERIVDLPAAAVDR
jgi:hypothetical protein